MGMALAHSTVLLFRGGGNLPISFSLFFSLLLPSSSASLRTLVLPGNSLNGFKETCTGDACLHVRC